MEKGFRASGQGCGQRIRHDRQYHCKGSPAQRWRKRGDRATECIGRSKGGLTTKIHATCDALGNPTGFHLTPGQAHDLQGADTLLPELISRIKAFLADKAYDAARRVLYVLEKADVEAVIPPKRSRTDKRLYDLI